MGTYRNWATAIERFLAEGGEPLEPVEHVMCQAGNLRWSCFIPREGDDRDISVQLYRIQSSDVQGEPWHL